MRLIIPIVLAILAFSAHFFCQEDYQQVNTNKILELFNNYGFDAKELAISSISGGMTNDNYKVSFGTKSYFVRCSCVKNTFFDLSTKQEWICNSIASSNHLSPQTVLYNKQESILITDYVNSKKTVNLRHTQTLVDFCHLLRKLHTTRQNFPSYFCPFQTINKYIYLAHLLGTHLPRTLYSKVLPAINKIKKFMPVYRQSVPCHLDLHNKNVLNDGTRLWFIDWEYAAVADPIFDLATVASTEHFSDQEMGRLLEIYYNRSPCTQEEYVHLYRMRILADVRWALWSHIQEKVSPLEEPFRLHGDYYYDEALKRISLDSKL